MDEEAANVENQNGEDPKPQMEEPEVLVDTSSFVIDNFDFRKRSLSQQTIISIHDVSYVIKSRSPPLCGKITEKTILSNITGIFPSGMNAIMGPTGCGKSSLLNVISGQKNPNGLSGTLLINGRLPPDNFKCKVGYVEQDDVIMPTLTVRENLNFSASLRLPTSFSSETRRQKVNVLIEELGLSEVADSKVGNELIRGISGGERKRTCIGLELITSPQILFLDEPTTGLDSSTAYSVMHLLKELSEKGKNIIFSIHQPRYSIYNLFNNITLLSNGVLVFQGERKEALSYFKNMGYICDEHNSPTDFFLDIINGDLAAVHTSWQPEDEVTSKAEKFEDHFKTSTLYRSLSETSAILLAEFNEYCKTSNLKRHKRVPYNASFLKQLKIVSIRALKNLWRNPEASTLLITITILFAVVIGLIYFQLDESRMGLQNRNGVIFFIIVNQMFSSLSALDLFLKERLLFIRENSRGFYRCSSYFLAKVTCDIVPMRVLPVTIFCIITYLMIGFKKDVEHFFIYYITVFFTTITASCVSFAISSGVSAFAVANTLIGLCFVFMMLFSGFLVHIDSLPKKLQWIKYTSLTRYGTVLLSINELKDMSFCPIVNGNKNCNLSIIRGNDYLDEQNIKYGEPWDLWHNLLGFIFMIVVSLIIAYITLLRINKMK